MDLPEPRDFGWTLRKPDTAHMTISHLFDGRAVFTLDHAPLPGVTADMLSWWYRVFTDLQLKIDGHLWPAFFVSHPYDHVSIKSEKKDPKGRLQVGDYLLVKEVYQRNPKFPVSERAQLSQLDRSGMSLRLYRGKLTVGRVATIFKDGPEGALVQSQLSLGVQQGIFKYLVNRFIVPQIYDEPLHYAWAQHNIEEIGAFVHFLPDIYSRRDQGMTIRWERNRASELGSERV